MRLPMTDFDGDPAQASDASAFKYGCGAEVPWRLPLALFRMPWRGGPGCASKPRLASGADSDSHLATLELQYPRY